MLWACLGAPFVNKVLVIIYETWSLDTADNSPRTLAPSCRSYLYLKILNKDPYSRALDADRRINQEV